MSDFATLDRTATSQYGLLTIAQLQACGLSLNQISYRVKHAMLHRLEGGVIALPGMNTTWERRVCAATLAARTDGGASHRSAARLWGFRTVDAEVEISVRYPRHLHLSDVIVHRSRDLARSDITSVNGISTTTPERTICDLGLIFPKREVSRILHHAIATNLVNRYDLWRMRYRTGRQGRNGSGVLGAILEDLPPCAEHTESGPEVLFLAFCKRFHLPDPVLQLPVSIDGKVYRLDFAYPANRVFVEIDGYDSHGGVDQIAKDDGRQNDLVAAGWNPQRFTYGQLLDTPHRCAESLRRTLGFVPDLDA